MFVLTNTYFDFIVKGDETGCREDRGQLWPLPGSAERLPHGKNHTVLQSKARILLSTLQMH